MATSYYERAHKLADSLKYEPIKSLVYRSIISNYLSANEPQKALNYFNEHPKFIEFFKVINFGHFVDQSYGYIYTQLGKYDSAKYYYKRGAPFFEHDGNTGNKLNFYFHLGSLYKKTKEYDSSFSI